MIIASKVHFFFTILHVLKVLNFKARFLPNFRLKVPNFSFTPLFLSHFFPFLFPSCSLRHFNAQAFF